jgi:hypothetical protein
MNLELKMLTKKLQMIVSACAITDHKLFGSGSGIKLKL